MRVEIATADRISSSGAPAVVWSEAFQRGRHRSFQVNLSGRDWNGNRRSGPRFFVRLQPVRFAEVASSHSFTL